MQYMDHGKGIREEYGVYNNLFIRHLRQYIDIYLYLQSSDFMVLQGIDFSVRSGLLTGVIGPVGAGKVYIIGLLPHTQNCGLRMCRECRKHIPRHRLQRKPLVSNPGMHDGTCAMHVPWCKSGSLTRGGGKNVPGIAGACATAIVEEMLAHGFKA